MSRLAVTLIFVAASGCAATARTPDAVSESSSDVSTVGDESAAITAPPPTAPDLEAVPTPFRIATWNIENLSRNKLADAARAAAIVAIMREFEVVAVEELSDSHLQVGEQFLEMINDGGDYTYAASISPRTGIAPSDHTSQEQYGVYYRDDLFDVVSEELYPEGATNRFVREPWIVQLRHVASGTTFALVVIHAVPRSGRTGTVAEIGALADVVTWVVNEREEPNVIVLGDMNAGVSCSYVTQAALEASALRRGPYTWVVPDEADTNTAESQCAHDRIVLTAGGAALYDGAWAQDDEAFNPERMDLSDHWPVWASFHSSTNE